MGEGDFKCQIYIRVWHEGGTAGFIGRQLYRGENEDRLIVAMRDKEGPDPIPKPHCLQSGRLPGRTAGEAVSCGESQVSVTVEGEVTIQRRFGGYNGYFQ